MTNSIIKLLFNFNTSYIYVFISGIFLSISVNVITSILIEGSLKINTYMLYWLALALVISSIGSFGISILLEKARDEWESEGSPRDPEVIRGHIEEEKRFHLMKLTFLIILISLMTSIFLVFGYGFISPNTTVAPVTTTALNTTHNITVALNTTLNTTIWN